MEAQVHALALGVANCYLITEEGTILVDAGGPNQATKFLRKLRSLSIEPKDVSLIAITHAHWDHVGSLAELKRMTECQVAVNRHEKDWIEEARKPHPPGIGLWGSIFSFMGKTIAPWVKFPATSVDIVLDDTAFDLGPFGIRGKIVHTPGHSPGSSSVILESGDTFVGDMAMNGLPQRIGPGMPCVGDDPAMIRQSWRMLLDMGAKTMYPGHGKPFEAKDLARQLG
jgi:glyoxylase-like metal-dependent hydrolase (beta-lactamase superfamily II)